MTSLRDLSAQHPRYRLDRAFYQQLLASKPRFNLVERFVMPPRSGKGFIVKKGQTFRVVEEEGPQIADVALYNADNPGESFRSLRTFAVEGWFLKRFTRLWSEVPWFRPMATCIDETLDFTGRDDDFHHHLVASHCSPEVVEMRSGHTGLNACRLNLLEAIEPFGLTEDYINDNLDVFQKSRVDTRTGTFYGSANDSTAGDYMEFFAEINLLIAVSNCPAGDYSGVGKPPGTAPCRPLAIEIYDTSVAPEEFPRWTG